MAPSTAGNLQAASIRLCCSWIVDKDSLESSCHFSEVAWTDQDSPRAARTACALQRGESDESAACVLALAFPEEGASIEAVNVMSTAKFVEIYSAAHANGSSLLADGHGDYLGTVRCSPVQSLGEGGIHSHPSVTSRQEASSETAEQNTTQGADGCQDTGKPPVFLEPQGDIATSRRTDAARNTDAQKDASSDLRLMCGSLKMKPGSEMVQSLRLKFLGVPAPKNALHLARVAIQGKLANRSSTVTFVSEPVDSSPKTDNRAQDTLAGNQSSRITRGQDSSTSLHGHPGHKADRLQAISSMGHPALFMKQAMEGQAKQESPFGNVHGSPMGVGQMGHMASMLQAIMSQNAGSRAGVPGDLAQRESIASFLPRGASAKLASVTKDALTPAATAEIQPPMTLCPGEQASISQHDAPSPGNVHLVRASGDGVLTHSFVIDRLAEQDKKFSSVLESMNKTSERLQQQLEQMSLRVARLETKLFADTG